MLRGRWPLTSLYSHGNYEHPFDVQTRHMKDVFSPDNVWDSLAQQLTSYNLLYRYRRPRDSTPQHAARFSGYTIARLAACLSLGQYCMPPQTLTHFSVFPCPLISPFLLCLLCLLSCPFCSSFCCRTFHISRIWPLPSSPERIRHHSCRSTRSKLDNELESIVAREAHHHILRKEEKMSKSISPSPSLASPPVPSA